MKDEQKIAVAVVGHDETSALTRALISELDRQSQVVLVTGGLGVTKPLILDINAGREIESLLPDERQPRNRPDGWYRQFEKHNSRKNFTNK